MARDAADLARMLAGRIPQLAAELFPHGRRDGQEWRVGSLAGEPGQSLAIHLTGIRAGVWCDFSTGERGDALDLAALALYGGNRSQAMVWARSWLGLGDGSAPPAHRKPPPPATAPDRDPEAEARQGAARHLFLSASPSLAGTPAAAYLAGRGIDLAELGRQPRSLRFHPALPNRESGRSWPALVAAVTNTAGALVAVHRTWLARDRRGAWRKAPLRNPKMSLGAVAGGTIRLWRGASRKPLADAPAGDVVLIAEGIETALSCALACPELRVLSAVSLSNLGRVELPPVVRNLIIAADNDQNNPAAAEALRKAVDRFLAEGRSVRIARSPHGKDFNDALTAADVT